MPLITIYLPPKEIETFRKAKGDRTWREIMEDALFVENKPGYVSHEEMEAFVNLKLSELKEELKK